MGDPIEVAGLNGIQWSISAEDDSARPGKWAQIERQIKQVKEYIRNIEREGKLRDAEDKSKLKTLEAELQVERTKSEVAHVI